MALVDFTEAELAALREIARRVLGGSINAFDQDQSQKDTYEDHQAPEVYIAKTPTDGILALTNGDTGTGTGSYDEPGSATCDIYCIDETDVVPDLRDILKDELVYNISETAIEGSIYVLASRDKFGHWVVVSSGGGENRRRFKLKTALSQDGSATAYLVGVVDGALRATDTEFTIHDGMSEFEGVAGTLGLAEYWTDMDRWEVYQMACAVSDAGTGTGTP